MIYTRDFFVVIDADEPGVLIMNKETGIRHRLHGDEALSLINQIVSWEDSNKEDLNEKM